MRYTPDAEVLVELLDGRWQRRPPDNWTLSQLSSARRAANRSSSQPGTLVYTGRSTKSLRRLQRTVGASRNVAVLSDQDLESEDIDLPVLQVADVREALDRLGREARKTFGGSVIAITGSAGKTTTKSIIQHVLSPRFSIFNAKGNYLSAIRSQTLQMAAENVALFEVARVSLPGAEQFLSPDIVVITSISEAHMEGLGTLEDVAKTKAILLEGLGKRGTAIINMDAPYAEILLDKARTHAGAIITYGESKEADLRLVSDEYHRREVTVAHHGEELTYTLGLSGKHNALNSLSVLCVLSAMGLKLDDYLERFETIEPVSGRGDVSELALGGRKVTLVDQSYNANPGSMKAALVEFGQAYPDQRKILVLGDMAELGPTGPELHHELVETVLSANPAQVFLVGPLMGEVWKELPQDIQGLHSIDAAPVATFLPRHLEDGDVIMVKASNSTGLANAVKTWRSAGHYRNDSLRLVIFGDVQQVGYRNWAKHHAERHGVSGWVRNRSDGAVEALIHGDSDQLGHLLHDLHVGPSEAHVASISSRTVEFVPRPGFRLRKTRTIS